MGCVGCKWVLLKALPQIGLPASTAALMHGYPRYAQIVGISRTIISPDEKMKRSESDVAAKACAMKALGHATPHVSPQVSECRLQPLLLPSKNFVSPSPDPHSQVIPFTSYINATNPHRIHRPVQQTRLLGHPRPHPLPLPVTTL